MRFVQIQDQRKQKSPCITKLILGDSLESIKKIPNKSIDLIVTDPPYEVITTGGGNINKVKKI